MDLKEEGIRAFILDKLEDKVSTDIISEHLQRRFGLTEEQALKEIELYSRSINA